ncbi:MAG: hypothetical protein P3M75_00120 [Candidatus Hodgkinia cicadicola]|nr:MAG: hypothetical protein P3M75_00120 [Candidatus Hodgkinia cicadicola]
MAAVLAFASSLISKASQCTILALALLHNSPKQSEGLLQPVPTAAASIQVLATTASALLKRKNNRLYQAVGLQPISNVKRTHKDGLLD